jgi:hypothetical protein
MRKSLYILLALLIVWLLSSCKTTLIGKDKPYYSKYMVNYKNGQSQVLIYLHHWDVMSMIDTTGELKLDHIDTLQYKVKQKDLN